MKLLLRVIGSLLLSLMMTVTLFSQVEERLRALDKTQVNKYIEPMSAAVGLAFNSGTYYTARIPSEFSFSLGFTAPVIIIPADQTTFTPDLPEGYSNERSTATVFGNEGGYYAGPAGYIVYPPGINRRTIPTILPQASFSAAGTRLLIRYFPYLDVGETKVMNLGLGLSHNISRYIPGIPFDFSIQGLFSRMEVKGYARQDNFAFNVHASKELGLFTLFTGLQYERSSLDLNYTFRVRDPANPNQFLEQEISTNLVRNNIFRFTLGGSVRLSVIRIHGDINLGPQFFFNQGISLEF